MSKEFEQFLIDEKENFCRFFCKYNKLNIFEESVDLDLPCDCDSCDNFGVCEFANESECKVEINLCECCLIDCFIEEIRDKWG